MYACYLWLVKKKVENYKKKRNLLLIYYFLGEAILICHPKKEKDKLEF